jgi:isopentenyl diphosphate isomerase/L-lactate dehydrogenase-like FMN-dependent dehydrogenase
LRKNSGVAAVVVSNHVGRQLDTAIAGIDALLAVAGEQGAADVLNLLRSEIENALALCGAPSATDLPPALVV